MNRIFIFILLVILIWPISLEGSTSLIKITVSTANVRKGANIDSAIIANLSKGTILESISRVGSWYLVKLPKGISGTDYTGYIHYTCIEEIQPSRETRIAPVEPAAPQTAPQRYQSPPAGRAGLLSGFFIKIGAQFAPGPISFSHAWLPSFGYDFSLSPNFSAGFEFQPAVRSWPDINFTQIPLMIFGNIKGGMEALPKLKVFGGAGAGTVASFESLTLIGGNVSDFNINFAFQILSGIEYKLQPVSLILEYQLKSLIFNEATVWGHYLLFGIRF